MDLIRIGKFVADERKRKGYTQKQLAEILGISNKTISKWECGNGFPEASLLLPLCEELEISVNELLAGERVSSQEYRRKAEENMVEMIKTREENKKRLAQTTITGVIATVSFLTISFVVCAYTETISLPVKVVLKAVACAVFAAGLYVAMQGECHIGYYRCGKCGEYFVPTFSAYSRGAHFFLRRRLKCPGCGKSSYCKKVLAKEETEL